jgi:DNA-binding response OmpR family regulator
MEELIVRIQNALRNKTEAPKKITGDSVTMGKYTFQLNRQVLNDGKEDRKLSYRESELLKVLYENRDKIIDRKDILNLLGAMIISSTAVILMCTSPSYVVI